MTEEKPKLYSVKLSGVIKFIDDDIDMFEDVDVIRESESSLVLLKEKMPELDLFKYSTQYPLRNIKSIKTEITEAKEIE